MKNSAELSIYVQMKEIRQIIHKYERSDLSQVKLAIASVVNVEESSYRRIGARMLVSSNGNWIGGISGGCLEGDALQRSQKAIFKNVPSRVVYDTMEDDENEIGVGLGCSGRIEVLFSPIDSEDTNNPIELLKKIVAQDQAMVLITVIEVEQSEKILGKNIIAYRPDSAPNFLDIDINLLEENIKLTYGKKRSTITEVLSNGEKIKLLFEFIRPEMRLVIVGENYDVNALVGIVNELGWDIFLVGHKKKMHKSTFKRAKEVYDYKEFDKVPIDEYTSVLLMTHDFNLDKTILKKVIDKKPNYVGLLGPKKRGIKMETEEGLEDILELDFLHSPVGLDIGAETPEEIAISIVSEILAVFRNRAGNKLKKRDGTIHDRNFI